MLKKRSKGLYVELTDTTLVAAVTSGNGRPLVVESLHKFPRTDSAAIQRFTSGLLGAKGSRFVKAHVGCTPESRFLRRHTVEAVQKAKEANYLIDVLENTFKLDTRKIAAAVVNAQDGTQFSADRPMAGQKELIFTGANLAEFEQIQKAVIDVGIFPLSLELTALSVCGALKHILKWKGISDTALLLEFARNQANLVILGAERVELCRPMPFGTDSMVPLIQRELGLRDEQSARKLFQSNTFDFTEMGSTLLRRTLKELQASTGFYEVQTGQSIPYILVTQLDENLQWIPGVVARDVGLTLLEFDYAAWLESLDIQLVDEIDRTRLGPSWLGVFSLMIDHSKSGDGGKKEK